MSLEALAKLLDKEDYIEAILAESKKSKKEEKDNNIDKEEDILKPSPRKKKPVAKISTSPLTKEKSNRTKQTDNDNVNTILKDLKIISTLPLIAVDKSNNKYRIFSISSEKTKAYQTTPININSIKEDYKYIDYILFVDTKQAYKVHCKKFTKQLIDKINGNKNKPVGDKRKLTLWHTWPKENGEMVRDFRLEELF
jgi:hypothetical protein